MIFRKAKAPLGNGALQKHGSKALQGQMTRPS